MTRDPRTLTFAAHSHGTQAPAARSDPDREAHPRHSPVVITVAEVMFGTAATRSRRAGTRWLGVVRRMRTASRMPRTARGTHSARRESYIEQAAMAREMYRL